jgi:aryl-alcohol dehydrogenase-like predicted oxidoreductase
MDYVRLGKTGLKVSPICLGCMSYGSTEWEGWALDAEQAKPFFKQAFELGINFFDTADIYSRGVSEEITGRWIKTFAARREEVVLATKLHAPMGDGPNDRGQSRKHIMDAIDASLKRLGVDYVDLYQIHRFDYETPIEEVCEALNDVVRAGKARYIGASSMWAWQFMKMLATQEKNGWSKFVSMQPIYNLVAREEEREMLPLCLDQGVGVIPWSPLGGGYLARGRAGATTGTDRQTTSRFARPWKDDSPDLAILDAVEAVAKKHGVSNAAVAIAWCLKNPAVTAPIVGATKAHHLADAVAGLDVKLSPEDIEALEKPYVTRPVTSHQ